MAFCSICGQAASGAFCASCGSALGASEPTSAASSVSSAALLQINVGGQRQGAAAAAVGAPVYPPPVMQAEGNSVSPYLVTRWNWGAFLLPWLWPFWHGAGWIGVVVLICSLLSFLGLPALIALGFAIYLGVKGGQIAVQRRLYGSDEQFQAVEGAWTKGGIIALIISILISILMLPIMLALGVLNAIPTSAPHY